MVSVVFDQVIKQFGQRQILKGLSFELPPGRRYGLLGPNGAGKSTLIRLIIGALRPEAGRVLVNGLAPWQAPVAVRSILGVLPEGAPLVRELTVREHFYLAGRLRGIAASDLKSEEERLVPALGLAGFYDRPAGILSQGQKRRAALASALLGSPQLLVLDEPTSGLDPEEAARLLALLKNLPDETTLLVSSHILGEVFEITDQVMVINRGALVANGSWADFIDQSSPGELQLRRRYLELTGSEVCQ